MRKTLLLIILFNFSFGSLCGPRDEQLTINLVGEPLAPVTNADGSGQQFEVVKEIFQPLGHQVNISVFPYKRALYLVENGQADMMIGMFKDDSFDFIYSNWPHDVDNLLVIYPTHRTWQGVQELQDKRVTVLDGLTRPLRHYLPNFPIHISEVKTRQQAVNKLAFQRSDFMLDTEGSYLLTQELEHDVELKSQHIGYVELYVAFANTKRGEKAKAVWDAHYRPFILTDKAKNIYHKWGLRREYQVTKAYFEGLEK